MSLKKVLSFIPEVKSPEEKNIGFKDKAKWTIIILLLFFILANIPLFGLSENALEQFEYLAIVLGTDFGSIISLGVGPIVMASIILQLLAGSGILNINTDTAEGRKFFQGLQKILAFFFIIFQSFVFVLMQGLQALPGFKWIVILQLILGGLAIYYMSEVTQKWGLGSGISLFIAAGVSWRLFSSAFQFINQQGKNCLFDIASTPCTGKVLVLLQSIITRQTIEFGSALASILITVGIFLMVVWAQSLKVEIPLSFGRVRGYGVKWPLSFFYAGVIPVILTAALVANLQLFGGMIENTAAPCLIDAGECVGAAKIASYFTFLGRFSNGAAVSGLAFWVGSTNILDLFIRGGFLPRYILQGITHTLFFMGLSTLFAIFWVKTSGYDSKSQAKKIASSGLQVAGFRQDQRVLESILDRYIMPLTVMGGLSIGFLASITNLMGALVSGTAILLVIMIANRFYKDIAKNHMSEINPGVKSFIGG